MFVADVQPPEGTVIPVIDYAQFWLVLGFLILAAIVAYYFLVVFLTRPRPPKAAPVLPPARPPVYALQQEYLERVDDVARRAAAGELTPRRAHAELSVLVRGFVAAVSTVPADKMTLTDLRRTELRGVSHTVGQYYPMVFGAHDPSGAEAGVAAAREAISTWR